MRIVVDDPVPLPADLVEYEVSGKHLFNSASTCAYVTLCDPDAALLREMASGVSLRAAAASHQRRYGIPDHQLGPAVTTVLEKVYRHGLLATAHPVEQPVDTSPLQCYLTFRCSLQCTHCYVSAIRADQTTDELTTAEWFQVLDEYADVSRMRQISGEVILTGGEPTIRRDLAAILDHARSLNLSTTLFTNGLTLARPQLARELVPLCDHIQVSLDGASESVNDSIRGRGSFNQVVRAMNVLSDLNAHWRLAITVMPQNVEDLRLHLVPLIESFPLRFEVRLALANVLGRATRDMTFSSTLEGERLVNEILDQLYERGLRTPRDFVSNLKAVSCGYGRMLAVAPDGAAYGCAVTEAPLGHLRRGGLGDAFTRAAVLAVATDVDHVTGCCDCDLRYICAGTCRLNNVSACGDLCRSCCTSQIKTDTLERMAFRSVHMDQIVERGARDSEQLG
jgi:radical SAM protein with 4Fe4S-binding SPASM domain